MKTTRRRIDINLDELDQIIDRGMQAPLSQSEGGKLKTALHAMADRLLAKRSTEKTSAVLPRDSAPADQPKTEKSAPAGHGRNGADVFTGGNRVRIDHPTFHPGDTCPECLQGKVYHQKEPATLVRFVGQAPLEATVFEMERLRCNACGEVFTAAAPEAASGADKYDETAVASVALLKYGTGVPFKRLERLQGQLGMPLPATGTFTTGIVSILGACIIALYFTGWKHAGEHLADVLQQRARELPPPAQRAPGCATRFRATTRSSKA